MAQKNGKKTIHRVEFSWGAEYGNNHIGIKNITINVADAQNKFDALLIAFNSISHVVGDIEPARMNVTSQEVCE